MTTNKPVAVLISDVHYNLQTLEVADKACRIAIDKANELNVTLIVCGDLHDTKANIRGECIKAMRNTFVRAKNPAIILRGNHDSINERSVEHSLEFFTMIARVVATPEKYDVGILKHWIGDLNAYLIPYHHDANELRAYLKTIPKGSRLIMHQGLVGSESGEYIQDKSALNKADLAGFRVISGHYHKRQTLELPDGGKFDYVGNPYTLGFGEANDPEKGYQILYDDGSLEFVPTNLRKHVIWNEYWGINTNQPSVSEGDLLWIKMHGTKEQLLTFSKSNIPLSMPFRLDLIPTETKSELNKTIQHLSVNEVLDQLIDSLTNTSDERKARLKHIWKGFR